jgi:hypothetical protein
MTCTGVGILVRHALEFREGKVVRGPREGRVRLYSHGTCLRLMGRMV